MNGKCFESIAALSVYRLNLQLAYHWVRSENISIQILFVKIYAGNPAVFVGGIIIKPFICVAAAGVDGLFIFITDFYAALGLGNGRENMKKLTDIFVLAIFINGIEFGKRCSDKTR